MNSIRNSLRVAISCVLALSTLVATSSPAVAAFASFSGHVTDAVTAAPLNRVCVWLGPVHLDPSRADTNCTFTDPTGFYHIDNLPTGLTWPLTFHLAPDYKEFTTRDLPADGPIVLDVRLQPTLFCGPASTATPTMTTYLPNVTKTLGGPTGFQTPFIVQNTGSASTSLEVSFYRFSTGACVARRTVSGLMPGTSFADVPNNDADLPDDTQFSVVVRSFGASIVSVVNQHRMSDPAEADAYVGTSVGATTVYLPNVVRRFFGFHSPAIIQNLGTATTTATASYVSFDGSAPAKTFTRTIAAGQSQFIEPNSDDPALGAPGLVDGKQYSVTVTATQPIAVVLNTHNDDPGVANPVFYTVNGIAATSGGSSNYGAYASKNAAGINRVTTIVVQNLVSSSMTPSLQLTPMAGGAGVAKSFTAPAPIAAGAAWAFDPRFVNGVATTDQSKLCGSADAPGCLADGEYAFTATASGAIATVVNVLSLSNGATAMGYSATAQPATKYFLPNVTLTLGGDTGWTTPIVLQSVGGTTATLKWYSFQGGTLVTTQNVTIPLGSSIRIDPRNVAGLTPDTQYAVVVQAAGTITAIVQEFASGGDNAMTYGGFPAP